MPQGPFRSFRISPSYLGGFLYSWEVGGGFSDPGPWTFAVQRGHTAEGPWETISPPLVNVVAWHEDGGKHLYGKSNVLHFRAVLRTPAGTYFSHTMQPYGDLPRREYLLAREIIRRECLRARVLAGVECDVYVRSTFGPKCRRCVDPVTGDVRDSHCRVCLGTGRDPAYFGPHRMMMSFSPDVQHAKQNSEAGTRETKAFEAQAIGNPVLKKGDVVVDRDSDRRYVVGTVGVVSEVRRVACLQRVSFEEAPLSDPVYRIGAVHDGGEGCDD